MTQWRPCAKFDAPVQILARKHRWHAEIYAGAQILTPVRKVTQLRAFPGGNRIGMDESLLKFAKKCLHLPQKAQKG
jgi:hypothetical protein